MQIPPKLKSSDEVIILAPARKVNKNELNAAVELLRSWNLVPLFSENLMEENGVFAGD